MKDLFQEDRSLEKDNLVNDIKSNIQNYYENKLNGILKLQKKINNFSNFKTYEYYRLDQSVSAFRDHINNLYKQFKEFLDSTEEEFYKAFPGNFGERVYELVMLDFLHKKFNLQKRLGGDGEPDIKFQFNGKPYILECTTRNTSLMNEFYERLPVFNSYFKVAKIFDKRCRELILDKSETCWEQGGRWHFKIDPIWRKLGDADKKEVNQIFLELHKDNSSGFDFKESLEKMKAWIRYNLYAYLYFRDLLPSILTDKLKIIFPDNVWYASDDSKLSKLRKFLINSIALKVIEKLKKPYSNEKIPVIVSVSLSTLPEEMSVHSALKKPHIAGLLQEEVKKEADKAIKNTELKPQSLKNLYAIIVDTTWYNWFPDIVEQLDDAHFSDSCRNCYLVFYNKNITEDFQCDPHIFDSLIGKRSEISVVE